MQMVRMDIESDLRQVMAAIATITAAAPDRRALQTVAAQLREFVQRHKRELTFEHFPLPAAADQALCRYVLHEDASGLTLWLNSIRGGVDSAVHDHGTWAVIVAIEGQERNRIYQRTGNGPGQAVLALQREVLVGEDGSSLVLEGGLFHSIHTGQDEPTLQLHLYGQPIDRISGRQVFDPQSGELRFLLDDAES